MATQAEPDYVIKVEGLSKSFGGKTVVDDLSLTVRQGQIYGFLGPNGSGKTTTLRMLCGLLKPDSGRGTTLGYDITNLNADLKRRVGYMTQRFSLYEDLSIRENLEFVARVYGVADVARTVQKSLDRLGLTDRQSQLAGQLSGGWKQRLALGACILPEPQLLLLDEPTAGVDPKARREFWGQIHHLAADGMTVLVSTHYMDEAERCHEIAYIAHGNLLARGTIDDVVAEAGLITYTVTGPDLATLADDLEREPGVETVAAFGNSLHIAGRDADALDKAIARYGERTGVQISKSEASLEDVFISLMSRVGGIGHDRIDPHNQTGAQTSTDGWHGPSHVRHADQGVRAASPRSPDIRHDDLHPPRPAAFVWLRHQHHAAKPANGTPGA